MKKKKEFIRCLFISLFCIVNHVVGDAGGCGTRLDDYGATFDLSPLVLPSPQSYSVKDIYAANSLHNYTYYFNLCQTVPPPFPSCGLVSTPAFQVYTGNAGCFDLGRTTNATDMTWRPIDRNDATVGIVLVYHNGESCKPSGIPRELHVHFICDDTYGELPDLFVAEDSTCHYKLEFKTIFGCPTECPIGPNRKLCSRSGFCGQDWNTNAPKCFCNKGHFGSDCSLESDPAMADTSCGGMCVGLVFVMLVLIMLAIGAVVMLWKVRKLALKKLKFAATSTEMNAVTPTGDV